MQEWKQTKYTERQNGKVLYVTSGENCYKIYHNEGSILVQDLCSTHEEADTRLMLHAAHAASAGFQSIVLVAEDTDVFLISLAFSTDIDASLYLKCGTRARISYVDIKKVAAAPSDSICKALIGMHAYTGCDSVSTFAGRGKITPLKMMIQDIALQHTFTELGMEWTVSSSLLNRLEAFICQLYAAKTSVEKVNELRYHMFCTKKGRVEPHQLPPCADALNKHVLRANYQTAVWRRSLQANPEVPSPKDHGWKVQMADDKEELSIDRIDGAPAPETVFELLACNCSRSCRLPQCTCIANSLKCSTLCKLKDCDNQPQDDEEDDTQLMDEDDEIEELEFD